MTQTAAHASVPTEHASRYLQQLAKHWAHKFPVEFTAEAATLDLPMGRCELRAGPGALEISLAGAPDTDMDRFQTVVVDHLQRFGYRETLVFDWG